jgi:hypothetical protein
MLPRRSICAVLAAITLAQPSVVNADPSVQSIDASSGSAACGSVNVTWSTPSFSSSLDPRTVAIHATDAAGNTVFDVSQETRVLESLGPVWCGDLLGDGRQVLNYAEFSGGAHCCFSGSVVLLDGSGQHLLDWGLGSFGLESPQQLDGSGALEIPGVSPLFSYYGDLSFVSSPTMPVVYAYDGRRYTDATARFPSYFMPELAQAEADVARFKPGQDQEGAALKVYALHLLLGDGDKALAGLQGRVAPATRTWLAAHAAEVRDRMAQAYTLPGASVAESPAPIAASPTIVPAPAVAAPTIIPAPAPDTDDSPPAAEPTDAGPPAGPPDTLTPAVRSDILDAVQRANNAWSTATRTLDASVLNGNVAGAELSSDLAELNNLRGRGQTRNNVNVAFVVTGVSLDAPGQATVHTHETWYAEMYSGGRLLQRTPSANYDETYAVEFQDGAWIVTRNDV